jgi:hypothetical protein
VDGDVEDEVMKAIAAQDELIDIGSEEEPIPPAPNIFDKPPKTKRKATPRKRVAKAPRNTVEKAPPKRKATRKRVCSLLCKLLITIIQKALASEDANESSQSE